jgi:DNA polymerase-3 subunit beta
MKIVIEQGTLLRELSLIQGIIEKKTTIPILANVLLTATEQGTLTITATDLEVGFRSSIDATVNSPGRVAVNARRLHEIVKKLPAGNIGFRQDDASLHLTCEKIKYRLQVQQAEQFPTVRSHEGNPQASVQASQLSDMVKRTLFAITASDPGYSLGGALFSFSERNVTMVATDGHRLAYSVRPAERMVPTLGEMLVPRKALGELGRLAADHDGELYLWGGGGHLFAVVGTRELNTSLQEHRFPDYKKVLGLSAGNEKKFQIRTAALREAIERVSVLSQERTHLVKLELGAHSLTVSAVHPELGEAQEELAVDYQGAGLKIGFNGQYLLDFLSAAGTDEVRISLGEEMGQGLFEPVRAGDDVAEDRYIVMPMALS